MTAMNNEPDKMLVMNFRNKALPVEQAKEIDMVSYLASLGYEPSKIVRDDHWYLSPLREERTASFKINRRLNRWYDHGMGKGGNLINFGMLYFKCSFGDFLKEHCGSISLHEPVVLPYRAAEQKPSKISIVKELPLRSFSLLHYFKERKIPLRIASAFCAELHYTINNHSYYGIGFKNDLGGFEIRNPYFKASSAPKGVTTYHNNSSEVLVFEGFFDFLSYKALHSRSGKKKQDFIILNSLSFLEKVRPYMEKHQLIRLYLDRDQAGEEHTRRALCWSAKYKDQSSLYKGYKDLNEWAVNSGKLDKKMQSRLRQ
jgi:hypothetical protein